MSRGSRFSSILQWFRTDGSVDEVRAIMPLCIEAAQARTAPPTKRAAPSTTKNERSAAAKRAWVKRRLNAGVIETEGSAKTMAAGGGN
jgi:hypothetical protein